MTATRAFGEHNAEEVVTHASTFLEHVMDDAIWPSLHEPVRGRMKPADVARGRALLATARTSVASSAHHKGDVAAPTHALDVAETAATHWLDDQLVHVRGQLHEQQNAVAQAALAKALTHSETRDAAARNIRAYIALAKKPDETGAALSASYDTTRSRDAILRDGEHLAEALEANVGAPATALGARHEAVVAKDDAVGELARWFHRWSSVAHRVVGAAGLITLGIAHARHHPAHRPQHPATTPPTGGTTPPTA